MARYVVGECTPEEAARVQSQLHQHSEDARLIAAIAERTAKLRAEAPKDLDVDGALAKVHARMATADDARVLPFPRQRWVLPSVGIVAAAAAIVAMVVLPRFRSTAPAPASGAATGPATSPKVYATAVGQRDSMLLVDGTSVIMGPGSRLTVSADYNRTSRVVKLEGQAYFNVRHNPALPFTVQDGTATLQDVGTAFAVADESDGVMDVTVTEGVVQLAAQRGAPQQGGPVQIRAGQRATIDAKGAARVTQNAIADSDLAWMHGRLEFRDAPLTRVSADLKRWYGVELRPDSSLAGRHFSGTINNDPLPNVLKMIGLGLGARAEQRGDTIFLHGPSAGHTSPQ